MECKDFDWREIGQKIKEARMAAEMSQTELAKKAGITNQFVCQIEAGKKGASVETLSKLAKVLKIDFFCS